MFTPKLYISSLVRIIYTMITTICFFDINFGCHCYSSMDVDLMPEILSLILIKFSPFIRFQLLCIGFQKSIKFRSVKESIYFHPLYLLANATIHMRLFEIDFFFFISF